MTMMKSIHRSFFPTSVACLVFLLREGNSLAFQAGTTVDPTATFWGQQRTAIEIEEHIHASLACTSGIDGQGQRHRVEVVSAEPPLVVIHDFLGTEHCRQIVKTAKATNAMQRSTIGSKQETSTSRTSSTVWLKDEDCPDPLRVIADKVASVTGLPYANMENAQVCRYQPTQEFKIHTDHLNSFNDLECRGRLATCLIYLEEPDAGGETWFPGTNDRIRVQDEDRDLSLLGDAVDQNMQDEVKVPPTQGSAVLFWNTLQKPGCDDYDPEMFLHADERMRHAGLPVLQGEKWICNRWIHPIDFGAGVRGV